CDVLASSRAREHGHWQISETHVCSDLLQHFLTVFPRQVKIEQYKVMRSFCRTEARQRLFSIAGKRQVRRHPTVAEGELQQRHVGWLILIYQNGHLRVRCGWNCASHTSYPDSFSLLAVALCAGSSRTKLAPVPD